MTAALDAIRAKSLGLRVRNAAGTLNTIGSPYKGRADEWNEAVTELLRVSNALDRAEAVVVAARVAHDAWFGGLIDSDYDRMAAIFDDLRAALAALDGTAEEQVRAALRAFGDADKVADE